MTYTPKCPEKHEMIDGFPFRDDGVMMLPDLSCRASGSAGLWVQHTGKS